MIPHCTSGIVSLSWTRNRHAVCRIGAHVVTCWKLPAKLARHVNCKVLLLVVILINTMNMWFDSAIKSGWLPIYAGIILAVFNWMFLGAVFENLKYKTTSPSSRAGIFQQTYLHSAKANGWSGGKGKTTLLQKKPKQLPS